MNAVIALAGAVAAANIALLVRRLDASSRVAPYFAAGTFVLAHTVWWLCTITESHAITAALMSGELLALVSLLDRPRITMVLLLGLLNGLGFSTHNLALLSLPVYGLTVLALVVRRRLPVLALPVFIEAWMLGAAVLLWLVVTDAWQYDHGLGPAISSALFGTYRADVLGGSGKAIVMGLGYIGFNFPNLAIPLAVAGLMALLRRRWVGVAIAAIGAMQFLFAIRYTVADQFMFFVPLYLVLAVLAGLGFARIAHRRVLCGCALAALAIGPVLYAVGPGVAHALSVRLPGSKRTLPFRDNARYWLSPWKCNENSAEEFAVAALDQVQASSPNGGIILADSTAYPPLHWVQETEGRGRNVELVDMAAGHADEELDRLTMGEPPRSLWIVSNVPGYTLVKLLPFIDPNPTGVLYRIVPPPWID
jgi:hypothetical protein